MTTLEQSVDADEALVRERAEGLLRDHGPATADPSAFLGAQFDAGLAWVDFPVGRGGLGLSPRLQHAANEVLWAAGAPVAWFHNPIGVGMCAPTILAHGTEEQAERWLRPLFAAEEIWCQLFSEPGAGSDVASLSTRAVRDGEEWVLSGQKVWTTLAHRAKWGLLIARSDPEQPKHRGLTCFAVDMEADGVEVRPLRQLTGDAEFNEVYFTDARVPDSQRLGDVGQGWSVALTTLMNERVAIGGVIPERGSGSIGEAVRIWRERNHTDPVRRDALVRLWVRAEAHRLTNARAAAGRTRGTPGPEGSVGKLVQADLNKDILAFCMDLLGMEGTLNPSGYELHRPERLGSSAQSIQKLFLRSRANSIEGGTSEIMRNILAERVLGLPGDVRVDKDRPWSEVPRS